ncbi:MAG: TlpA disulfide reductase family protein [Mariprofundaceae bacterium]|nr:TlpA disulfide reductase family protein [Mariprofundaceae bacterium]
MLRRWLVVGGLVLMVAGAAWFGLPESHKKIVVGNQIVDFSLPDLQGNMQSLPKGHVMLVNFWATWCPPCRKEMPSMIQLYQQYESQGLKIIAVSVDRDSKQLQDFVHEYQVPFDVRHDVDSAISTQYGVFRYPETFLVDKHGVIQAHLIGGVEWMSPNIRENIEALLADQALTTAL